MRLKSLHQKETHHAPRGALEETVMAVTVIYFTRHEKRDGLEVLPPEAIVRAVARGAELARQGHLFDVVVSSPRPRAIATALRMCEGNGTTPDFHMEKRISDFKTDPRVIKKDLATWDRLAHERFGDNTDVSSAKVISEMTSMHELLKVMAKQGAEALLEWAARYPDKNILSTSHGAARMELAIGWLEGRRGEDLLNFADRLIGRGEVVCLFFKVKKGDVTFQSAMPLDLLGH